MGKIFFIVIVLYIIFIVFYLLWERIVMNRKNKGSKQAISLFKTPKKEEIIGKSKFDLRHSRPQAATPEKSEKSLENTSTFVAGTEKIPEFPRRVPLEKLDEAFADEQQPSDEENLPMDIDYPLGYEDPPEEEADEPEEEYEELPGMGTPLADGVSFEQMGEAFRTIVHHPKKSESEQQETGRVLVQLKHTDMFEAVVSGNPEREDRVKSVISAYLSAFHARQAAKEEHTGVPVVEVPSDFDVRNLM
jgi:hypothetical protein